MSITKRESENIISDVSRSKIESAIDSLTVNNINDLNILPITDAIEHLVQTKEDVGIDADHAMGQAIELILSYSKGEMTAYTVNKQLAQLSDRIAENKGVLSRSLSDTTSMILSKKGGVGGVVSSYVLAVQWWNFTTALSSLQEIAKTGTGTAILTASGMDFYEMLPKTGTWGEYLSYMWNAPKLTSIHEIESRISNILPESGGLLSMGKDLVVGAVNLVTGGSVDTTKKIAKEELRHVHRKMQLNMELMENAGSMGLLMLEVLIALFVFLIIGHIINITYRSRSSREKGKKFVQQFLTSKRGDVQAIQYQFRKSRGNKKVRKSRKGKSVRKSAKKTRGGKSTKKTRKSVRKSAKK
jgi:competence protein ComGC